MSYRLNQVNQLIKKEIAQIILKEMDFSRNVLVTITRVETSTTLEDAKIFVSVIPQEESERILKTLENQIYYLQQKLNKRLAMKIIPKIRFLEEKETLRADRIEELLEQLKKEKK